MHNYNALQCTNKKNMERGKKNPALYWSEWSHSRGYPWIDLGWLCEVWARDGSKGENHYR